jgi:hypothetical protein
MKAMMTPKEYQQRVLQMLASLYPDKQFEITQDPLIIRYREVKVGLENLYKLYTRDQLAPKDRDEYIRVHFSHLITNLDIESTLDRITWDEIRGKILIQRNITVERALGRSRLTIQIQTDNIY